MCCRRSAELQKDVQHDVILNNACTVHVLRSEVSGGCVIRLTLSPTPGSSLQSGIEYSLDIALWSIPSRISVCDEAN